VSELPGLEHYALKSMDYGQLTGLSIACHAISDAFLLMHVGVGCKNKGIAHLLVHDWKEHANVREGWTEVGDQDLILGASERAGPYLRSWYKRLQPAVIVTTSVTFIDLAGEDLPDKVEKAAADLPCPVVLVKTPGYEPDLYLGYAKLVVEVCRRIDWSTPPAAPQRASLLGYLFDRYEGDHEGNLKQLEGLLKLVGLEAGPVLFSGGTWAEALQAGDSGVLIELPYTRPVRKRLARALGKRSTVRTDLPMGIRGTSRWLREVGRAVGADAARLERTIEQRERYVHQQLDAMMDRWRSKRVAVFADVPLAAGLCSLLIELGMTPVLVGLRGSTLGGREELDRVLDADGVALPEGAVVLDDPSLFAIREHLARAIDEGLDGVIGAAPDLNMLASLAPRSHVHDHVSGRLQPQGPFVLELGFPSRDHHAMMPMPYLGYGGVVVLAQRIVDAKRLWDAGTKLTFQL
jgi:nitrogenase molybdenum-iron protein alpha/beta subunit